MKNGECRGCTHGAESDTTQSRQRAVGCRCSTFGDVVSQEGVVDFGALSVLAHLKPKEGDPPARPS